MSCEKCARLRAEIEALKGKLKRFAEKPHGSTRVVALDYLSGEPFEVFLVDKGGFRSSGMADRVTISPRGGGVPLDGAELAEIRKQLGAVEGDEILVRFRVGRRFADGAGDFEIPKVWGEGNEI